MARKSKKSGKLDLASVPHEFLASVAAGEPVTLRHNNVIRYTSGAKKGQIRLVELEEYEYYPTFEERMEAAKAAAPYFAPRLNAAAISSGSNTEDLVTTLKELAESLPV